jgi:micrococcal nuclease
MKLWRTLICNALLFAGAAVLAAACQAQSRGTVAEAVVVKVADGDTVALATGERLRLLGIDTPEMEREGRPAEFLAHKAKAELARMVMGKKVRLEFDQLRYDPYGRLLAHVFLPDGTYVNAELVRQGLARVYTIPPNVRFKEDLLKAQRQALEARRGIWQKALKQDESSYLANKHSFRFHRPSCHQAQKISQGNRVTFDSLLRAYQEGFSPCRTCKP